MTLDDKVGPEELTVMDILDVLYRFEVSQVDAKMLVHSMKEADCNHGYTDPEDDRIWIHRSENVEKETFIKALIHELAHGYNLIYDLPNSEASAIRMEKATWARYEKIRKERGW